MAEHESVTEVPADLMRAAELTAYEVLKEDHREPSALWMALVHRAVTATYQQLRAELRPEYGIDATFASTRSATFTVADSLGDALKALEQFDAKRGDVVCRQLVERPVGEWRKVGGER